MILRIVLAAPVLVASDLLHSKTLYNLGAYVAGSTLRK